MPVCINILKGKREGDEHRLHPEGDIHDTSVFSQIFIQSYMHGYKHQKLSADLNKWIITLILLIAID